MALADLTLPQHAVLITIHTLLASGEYTEEFQATFPAHLASAILFFKHQALGATLLACPCTHADFLVLVQEGVFELLHQGQDTYWARVIPPQMSPEAREWAAMRPWRCGVIFRRTLVRRAVSLVRRALHRVGGLLAAVGTRTLWGRGTELGVRWGRRGEGMVLCLALGLLLGGMGSVLTLIVASTILGRIAGLLLLVIASICCGSLVIRDTIIASKPSNT